VLWARKEGSYQVSAMKGVANYMWSVVQECYSEHNWHALSSL